MNIVLDMDGTLVSEPETLPRPFLKEFLKYCFESFKTVSIWTAASEEHFDFVNKTIFKPILDEIKGEWNFVYTVKNCSVTYAHTSPYSQEHFYVNPLVVKPLKKLWSLPGFTKHNTLIVDDRPLTYSQNYGNAIPVDTYVDTYEDQRGDKQLELLIGFLSSLKTIFEECGTIRHVEKRFWFKT